jgi:hypothetical protein
MANTFTGEQTVVAAPSLLAAVYSWIKTQPAYKTATDC